MATDRKRDVIMTLTIRGGEQLVLKTDGGYYTITDPEGVEKDATLYMVLEDAVQAIIDDD